MANIEYMNVKWEQRKKAGTGRLLEQISNITILSVYLYSLKQNVGIDGTCLFGGSNR